MGEINDERSVIVFSSINLDMSLFVASLPAPGETTLSTGFARSLGGKGANAAVAAARAGVRSRIVGAVGTDDGGVLVELERYGVDVSSVARLKDAETGRAVIIVDANGENCIVVHAGANMRVTADSLTNAVNSENLQNAVLALHLEVPHMAVQDAACRAHNAGAIVVFNPSPVPRADSPLCDHRAALWSAIDVLIVNEGELNSLITGLNGREGKSQGTSDDIVTRVHLLRTTFKAGQAHVVVTLGSKGAALVRKDEMKATYINAIFVEDVIDTTGAGDCLTGYVCAGLARGWDLERSLREAVAAAALCVGRTGAADAMPSLNDVQELLTK